MKTADIVDSIYKAYGTDSGILFGIKERDIVKAIVEFTVNRLQSLPGEGVEQAAEYYREVVCGADKTERYLEKAFIAGASWGAGKKDAHVHDFKDSENGFHNCLCGAYFKTPEIKKYAGTDIDDLKTYHEQLNKLKWEHTK